MSGAKTMTLLAAGIAALCGAHFWLSTSPAASAGGKRRALAPFPPSRIVSLGVQRTGEKEIRLSLRDGAWRIDAPCAAAAEETAVMRLIDAISISTPVAEYDGADLARAGRSRADYGLESPLVEVVAADAGGRTCDIVFGAAVPGGKGIFASVAGADRVFAMDGAAAEAAREAAKGLRSRDVFRLRSGDVVSFDLKRGGGRMLCFRKQGGIWKKLAGQEGESDAIAPGDAVEAMLAAVCDARAEGFAWPAGAPDEPQTMTPTLLAGYGLDGDGAVALTARDSRGAEAKIVFGAAAAGSSAYALVQDSGAVALVPAVVKAAVQNADFSDARLFPAAADAIPCIAVADGASRFVLVRGEGGEWTMAAPVAAKADQKAACDLAESVAALSQADLDSGGVAVAIEQGGEPVFVARRSLPEGLRAEDLHTREMLRVAPGSVRRIALSSGGDGEVATEDAGAIAEFAAALDNFKAAKVVAIDADAAAMKRYGLDNPQIVLAIDMKGDGPVRRNILFGYMEDGGGRYAAVGASDTVFAISARAAQRLEIERKRLEKKQ